MNNLTDKELKELHQKVVAEVNKRDRLKEHNLNRKGK